MKWQINTPSDWRHYGFTTSIDFLWQKTFDRWSFYKFTLFHFFVAGWMDGFALSCDVWSISVKVPVQYVQRSPMIWASAPSHHRDWSCHHKPDLSPTYHHTWWQNTHTCSAVLSLQIRLPSASDQLPRRHNITIDDLEQIRASETTKSWLWNIECWSIIIQFSSINNLLLLTAMYSYWTHN